MDNAELYKSLNEKSSQELLSILENRDTSLYDDAAFEVIEQILRDKAAESAASQAEIPPQPLVPQANSKRLLTISLCIIVPIMIIAITVSTLRDRIEWRSVEKVNTIVAYEKFKNEYPDSSLVKEADTRIEKIKFAQTKEINSVGAYKSFIIEYPHSKFIPEARNNINSLLMKDRNPSLRNAKAAQIIVNYSSALANDLGTKELIGKWLELAGIPETQNPQPEDMIIQVDINARPLGAAYEGGYRYTGGNLDGSIEIKTHQNFSLRQTFHASTAPPFLVMLSYEGQYSNTQDIFTSQLMNESGFVKKITSLMSQAFGTQTLVAMLDVPKGAEPKTIYSNVHFTFGKDANSLVIDEAAKALVQIGKPAVDPLLNAVKNENNIYREKVIYCLGEIKDKRAVPELTKISNETKQPGYAAADGADHERANITALNYAAEIALYNITGK